MRAKIAAKRIAEEVEGTIIEYANDSRLPYDCIVLVKGASLVLLNRRSAGDEVTVNYIDSKKNEYPPIILWDDVDLENLISLVLREL